MKLNINWMTMCVVGLVMITFGAVSAYAQTPGPVKVEPVDLQPPGGWLLETGLHWETGRSLGSNTDYDNIRLHPVDVTYGFNDWVEFNAGLGYSSNSADNTIPDEGGFEGLTLGSKFKWNKNVATSVELGFLGSDEVAPYSNDGFNLDLNIPVQMAMGPGTLHGELGYKIQSGDFTTPNSTVDREGYINYGVGYVYEVNRNFGLSGEITGHGETIENAESMLQLDVGVPYRLSQTSNLKPSLTLGLDDGSPDFALGIDFDYKFGETTRYEQRDRQPQGNRFGKRSGTDQAEQQMGQQSSQQTKQSQDPLVMPDKEKQSTDQESKQQAGSDPLKTSDKQQSTSPYNPEKATKFAQEGRRAFENGNYSRAIDRYKKAVKYDPSNVEYHSNLGSLYYRRENYEQAKKHYQKAIQNDPRDYFSHLYLGATYYQQGNEEKARTHFERVLEIQPENEQAQNWLDRLE